jgi:hypothetical protein
LLYANYRRKDPYMQAPLTWEQVAALAIRGGFPPGPAVIATSITEPESARIQDNVQQGQPYATTGWGLWQITPGDSEPQFGINNAMLDGLNNARAAHAKWVGAGGFSPWTTWEHGLNQPYIPEAEDAVAAVTRLSKAQLDKLVADIRPPAAGPGQVSGGYSDWSPQVRATAQHSAGLALRYHDASAVLARAKPRFTPPRVIIPSPAHVLDVPARRSNGSN